MVGSLEGNGARTLVLIWRPLVFRGGSTTWNHTGLLRLLHNLLIEGVIAHHNCLSLKAIMLNKTLFNFNAVFLHSIHFQLLLNRVVLTLFFSYNVWPPV